MRVSSTVLLSLVFQIVSSRFRLPYDVRPIQYTITLKPDIDAGTFYGESAIDIVAENDRDELLIHACGLNVTHSSIDRTSTMLAERKDEMLAIWIENGTITAGNHTLRFRYFGFLRESLGLVKAAYGTNNYSGYLVVNDFEPDGARWAFPCFDEPRFKANFAIRLIAPNATYTALSNMPRVPASWGDTYDFVTSVKMSTYTVSFVITDYPHYEHVATLPNRTVPVRIYAHNATRINTEVVVGAATAAIKFYSDYTGIDYQLPKLDMIEYNQTGNTASEYWGLIHFKQGLLTSDFDVFDDWQRRLVVSHELAHFWFGNLVTNEWWEDLWLQEGMATFMSYKFMSEVYESPNIHIDVLELFVVEKSGAKPLFYNLTSRNDTEDRFDKVVYEKAALLLKNLECLVGPDTFRKSVMEYLDKNAYGTISTGQFVSLFEINSAQPLVRAYLESFLCQRGFPVVSVREVNATCYVITQDIYIDEHRWTVPVSYRFDAGVGVAWSDGDAVHLERKEGAKWVIFNSVEMPGPYIVDYGDKLWNDLLTHIDELDGSELHGLAANAGVLYLMRLVGCDVIFTLLERDRSLFSTLFEVVVDMASRLVCMEDRYRIFEKYVKTKSKYTTELLELLNIACRGKEIDVANGHAENCGKWIETNLEKFVKNK